ncbi:MAG: right-handed parallel beta-helix repeat-containing protein [Deltaproteobacteria bacterium]|nr:right-handed parallel beta-helix repeat-containing protein [Deltaproteobacteria bacterium]
MMASSLRFVGACAAGLLAACSTGAPVEDGSDAGDGGDEVMDGSAFAAPPVLTPCPAGWRETAAGPGEPATCEPWPDGDPAAPPLLAPCPPGWRDVSAPGLATVCDPTPEGGVPDCAADEAAFVGDPGCSRIGMDCPVGDWAEDIPGERTVRYVRAGAPAGGDGSRAAPFATIAEAQAGAPRDTVLALSKGTFDEAVELSTGITLWGACVAETIVACSTPSAADPTIRIDGYGTTVRNLRVGGRRTGIAAVGRRSVQLEGVLVEGVDDVGLLVATGATVTGHDVVVRDTQPRATDSRHGRGLDVETGAQVELARAVFEGNHELSVTSLEPGTVVTLTDVAVRDTELRATDGTGGIGLAVQSGGRAEIRRGVFEGCIDAAVGVSFAGSLAVLTDVVVRDARTRANGTRGRGLQVDGGGRAEVTRGWFERNVESSALIMGPGSTASLTDVVLRDTEPTAAGIAGHGLDVQQEARVEVARAAVEGSHEGGVVVRLDAVLTMTDMVVRGTDIVPGGPSANGLEVLDGASADVERAVFENNRGVAVQAGRSGSHLTIRDLVVRDTSGVEGSDLLAAGLFVADGAEVEVSRALFERNEASAVACSAATLTVTDLVVRDSAAVPWLGKGGHGLEVAWGSQVDVDRALFERNRTVAVVADGAGSLLEFTDAIVRDTQCRASDGYGGSGLIAQFGGQVVASRVLLERNRMVGAYAILEGSRLDLSDVVVRGTVAATCGMSGCIGAGFGVGAYGGGAVEMTRFTVSWSELCGLQLAHGYDATGARYPLGGTIDLHEGEVTDNPIGVNVQTDGFDIVRLADRVVFDRNGETLDSNAMPVPGFNL